MGDSLVKVRGWGARTSGITTVLLPSLRGRLVVDVRVVVTEQVGYEASGQG